VRLDTSVFVPAQVAHQQFAGYSPATSGVASSTLASSALASSTLGSTAGTGAGVASVAVAVSVTGAAAAGVGSTWEELSTVFKWRIESAYWLGGKSRFLCGGLAVLLLEDTLEPSLELGERVKRNSRHFEESWYILIVYGK